MLWPGELDALLEPDREGEREREILLMDKILHDLKDSKLWELRYIPCYG